MSCALTVESVRRAMRGETSCGAPPYRSPWRRRLPEFLRRYRNEILFAGLCVGVIEGLIEHERPLDLTEWSWWLPLAIALIAAGIGFRIAALGCIRKNHDLETRGVYSLCRHPLYLGTILAYAGFCVLLDDAEFWYFGLVYFPVFYTSMIFAEEARLRALFPAQYDAYRRRTPRLLPLGRPERGRFAWSHARQRGAIAMILIVLAMLGGVEVMARAFRPEALGGNDPPDSPIGIIKR